MLFVVRSSLFVYLSPLLTSPPPVTFDDSLQQDTTVASVSVDSLKPSQEHHSPDTDIVADVAVAVDDRQREDRRLEYTLPKSCPNDEYVLYVDGKYPPGL